MAWNWFEPIDWDGDGSDDYYDSSMHQLATNDSMMRGSRLSSMWGQYSPSQDRETAEATAQDMLRIRNAVRSLLKVHGLPTGTSIELATIGQQAMGCCTFRDQDNKERPLILLDKSIYDSCDGEYQKALDIYCGIGLHEASHANHTRLLFDLQDLANSERKEDWCHDEFTRPFNVGLAGRVAIFAGLFEDERIENLIRKESPGFVAYVQAAKRAIFETKSFGEALGLWDTANDMDRLTMLAFAFIRCPHVVKDKQKTFSLIDGKVPWDDFRTMFASVPASESQVVVAARKLECYFDKARTLYSDAIKETLGETAETRNDAEENIKSLSEDEQERLKRLLAQFDADAADKDYHHQLNELQDQAEGIHKEISGDSKSQTPEQIAAAIKDDQLNDKDDSKIEKLKANEELVHELRKGRFSLLDLQEALRQASTVTDCLNVAETREVHRNEEQRITFLEDWEWGDILPRKNVVIHPKPDRSKYKVYKDSVADEIRRMQNIFRLRLGTRKHRETERKSGRIHRRRLARSKSTDRLFYRKTEKQDQGVALCLLLDESGSMGRAERLGMPSSDRGRKAAATLQIAVLMAEALKGVPGVELEVYSYSSCGASHQDNQVKYLYGKCNPDAASIANYTEDGMENYDHLAIKTAVNLFKTNTVNKHRMMIVISDGQPWGNNYGGDDANEATKKEALAAEKAGVKIFHIAIENFKNDKMFKHSIKFTDIPELMNQMRRMITRLVTEATE